MLERTKIPELLETCIYYFDPKKGFQYGTLELRPITFQPVFAKIYSLLIRNRIYNFLLENQFIELSKQKGFWRAISGTIGLKELLTHVVKHTKIKQHQIIITLLDLKNAFAHSRRNKTINN